MGRRVHFMDPPEALKIYRREFELWRRKNLIVISRI